MSKNSNIAVDVVSSNGSEADLQPEHFRNGNLKVPIKNIT